MSGVEQESFEDITLVVRPDKTGNLKQSIQILNAFLT